MCTLSLLLCPVPTVPHPQSSQFLRTYDRLWFKLLLRPEGDRADSILETLKRESIPKSSDPTSSISLHHVQSDFPLDTNSVSVLSSSQSQRTQSSPHTTPRRQETFDVTFDAAYYASGTTNETIHLDESVPTGQIGPLGRFKYYVDSKAGIVCSILETEGVAKWDETSGGGK